VIATARSAAYGSPSGARPDRIEGQRRGNATTPEFGQEEVHMSRVSGLPASLLAIFLAFPGGLRAESPATLPDVHVGDRWTFQQRDGLTDDVQAEFTRRVVTVSPAEITAVQQQKGRPGQSVLYFTREWNLEDNGVIKYDPSPLVLHFPMKSGDTWQGQYKSRTLANGFTLVCQSVSKVAAHETIKVLAGSYDTLRIDARQECRGADPNAAAVQFATSNWYAPAVKAIVKTVSSGMFEGRERNRTVTEMLNYSLADRAEPAPVPAPPGQSPPAPTPATPSSVTPASPEKGI
jgi:hypothetical protein